MANKKKNLSRIKILWRLIGIVAGCIFSVTVLFITTNPVLAKTETKFVSQKEAEPQKAKEKQQQSKKNYAAKALGPIENDTGLKATPNIVTINQNGEFPKTNTLSGLNTLFSERVIPNGASATYEYVNEDGSPATPTSRTPGFQLVYVKITESKTMSSIIVPVPVTVTDRQTTLYTVEKFAFRVAGAAGRLILYPHETENKTKEQLEEVIKSKVQAWQLEDGSPVPMEITATTVPATTVGKYTADFEVTVEIDGKQTKVPVQTNVVVFGANKKVDFLTVEKGESVTAGYQGKNVFSKYQGVFNAAATDLTYQWVKNIEGTETGHNFKTSEVGFHWAYMKLTDKNYPSSISTVIRVGIMVTFVGSSEVLEPDIGIQWNGFPCITQRDLEGKTNSQIMQFLTEKLTIKAWRLSTGKELDVQIVENKINSSSVPKGELMVQITNDGQAIMHTLNILILPAEIFGKDVFEDWTNIPFGSTEGVIENPINHSKMGFPSRGMNGLFNPENEMGYIIRDADGMGYVYGPDSKVGDQPGINNKPLYRPGWESNYGIGKNYFYQYASNISTLSEQFFLKKGNRLKQLIYDRANLVLYEYDLSISPNLNFRVKLNMYNLSDKKRSFAMYEFVDTKYYDDGVPIYALGNNSGFYLQPVKGKRLSFKLKDVNGKWLSDVTKYVAGNRGALNDSGFSKNYFGNDFSGTGNEISNYPEGQMIIKSIDTAYAIAAPWKDIEVGKALKTGYEVFVGDELPYMDLTANPVNFDVYSDYSGDFKTNVELKKIPTEDSTGTIYVNYPDEKQSGIPFTSNSRQEFAGEVPILRDMLPEKLNEETGSIKEYDINLIAITESEEPTKGLPSKEVPIKLNVYNLGAQPIPQLIRKGTAFTKKASQLVRDPVVFPGHEATYEFVGDMPDTSVVGLTSVTVKMTDKDQPDQTALIKIPVEVVAGYPPTSGLYIAANDFKSNSAVLQNLTTEQLEKRILDKSEAIAWDVATGSTKNIELLVEKTTLPLNPQQGTYKATLKASKGTSVVRKEITITIQDQQKVNVVFVDYDTPTKKIAEDITFTQDIGTTINLAKEKSVQDTLESLLKKYVLREPVPSEMIEVKEGETTVAYKFSGKMFIESFPSKMTFGDKYLTRKFIKGEQPKYDAPLIIGDSRNKKTSWTLTATLEKPLTSKESPSEVLRRALWYRRNNSTKVMLYEGEALPIETGLPTERGLYNISENWDANATGLELNVYSNEIIKKGDYTATILWQISATP